jgi:hypothetical protein
MKLKHFIEDSKKLGRFLIVVGVPTLFGWMLAQAVVPPYNEWQVPAIVAIASSWAGAWAYVFTSRD